MENASNETTKYAKNVSLIYNIIYYYYSVMGILGEFFNFFNAVVLGPPKDDEGSDRDEILSALQSQSLMVNINQVIQRKILEYSSTIDQDVIANKTITID